jgi:hypothetical protein
MNEYQAFEAGTYAEGMAFVVGFIVTVFVVICVLDLVCAWQHWPSIGYRVQKWSRTNLPFVAGFLFILALLLTHFLGNAIHY